MNEVQEDPTVPAPDTNPPDFVQPEPGPDQNDDQEDVEPNSEPAEEPSDPHTPPNDDENRSSRNDLAAFIE